MLKAVKFTLKALGLQKVAWNVVMFVVKIKPIVMARRRGIHYTLDLRELIDFSIYLGGWEPETIKFLNTNLRPGDVVIEAGANVGAHTLIIAKMVGLSGRVYAYEPTAYARNKLLKNISLNPDLAPSIIVGEEFVTDRTQGSDIKEIRSSWRIDNSSRQPELIKPKFVTIDGLCRSADLNKVSLIKIDVDGGDYRVLLGATRAIARFRPIIFIELCEYVLQAQGDSIKNIFSELESLGYAGFYENGAPIGAVDDILRRVGMSTSINGIFRPRELENASSHANAKFN